MSHTHIWARPTAIALAALLLGLLMAIPSVDWPRAVAVSTSELSITVNADDSTTVTSAPWPSAASAGSTENRWMNHSDLQPTGRYVGSQQQIIVTVPADADTTNLSLRVGLYGPAQSQNGGADVGIASLPLQPGANTLTAPHDGMVFITNTSSAAATLVISGGTPVPTWIEGQTTASDFAAQLTRYPSAPYIELISDRMMGDFQADDLKTVIAAADLETILSQWDEIVDVTDRTYGLLAAADGAAHKSPNRIYIANPDRGPGYASATHSRITFQNETGAGADLFDGNTYQWGLWHEVGHTYQTNEYRWDGLTEVTVNISSIAVQNALTGGNRLDENKAGAAAYFALPVADRVFDDIGGNEEVWTKLLMFDQLRRGYGEAFYPRLSQLYRVQEALGILSPTTDAEAQQRFIRNAAEVTQRDLRGFFTQWGIPMAAETAAALARYPEPTAPIWENFSSEAPVVDYELATYTAPTARWADAAASVRIGETLAADTALLTDLHSVPLDSSVTVTSVLASTPRVGEGAGTIQAVLSNAAGVPNVVTRSTTVTPGTSLNMLGLGNESIAWLALDRRTHTFQAISTGRTAHSYFAGEEYFSAQVFNRYGTPVREGRVDGEQTADAFRSALTGTPYANGDYLLVRHAEPDRLHRYADDVEQAQSSTLSQWFLVQGDQLVPVSEPTFVSEPPPTTPSEERGAASARTLAATGTEEPVPGIILALALSLAGGVVLRRRRRPAED